MAEPPPCRLGILMRGGRFERRDGGGVPGGGVGFGIVVVVVTYLH